MGMTRRLWAAGVAVLLAWGCGGQEDLPVRVEAPRPDTGASQEEPPPEPPGPGPGPGVSDPLPPIPDVEATRQEFQWQRRLTGEQRHWGESVAFAPDGSTVLLTSFALPREDEAERQFGSIRLDAWSLEGAPRWSQHGRTVAPDDYGWAYELRGTASGVLVLDNPSVLGNVQTGVDLGCGQLFYNRLIHLDAEGGCVNQVKLQGEVNTLAVDGADEVYLAQSLRMQALPYQRLDAKGRHVSEAPPSGFYESDQLWLAWTQGGLVGFRDDGLEGNALVWLSPQFMPLRSRELPPLRLTPMTASPEGRIVTRLWQTEEAVRWGAREVPAGAKNGVLVVEADGSPGAAIVLESSLGMGFQVAADAHGLVIAGVSTSGTAPGPVTYSLELLAYGWDGALQRRQVVAEVSSPACDRDSYWNDSACRATLALSKLVVHPRHGIRLAGGVQGPAKFVAAGEVVDAREAQSFVMAFRR